MFTKICSRAQSPQCEAAYTQTYPLHISSSTYIYHCAISVQTITKNIYINYKWITNVYLYLFAAFESCCQEFRHKHAMLELLLLAFPNQQHWLTSSALKDSCWGSGRPFISSAEKEFMCVYHRDTAGCVRGDGGAGSRPTSPGSLWHGSYPHT